MRRAIVFVLAAALCLASVSAAPALAGEQCGCDDQCAGKGGKCFKCGAGGWGCGADSTTACGAAGYASVGPCPTSHDECGCDDQCTSKGASWKCFKCNYKGYNCGPDAATACLDANIQAVGKCNFDHDKCGCDSQCAAKGGKCYKCGAYGWNCGPDALTACQDANAAAAGNTGCTTTTTTVSPTTTTTKTTTTAKPSECVDGTKRCADSDTYQNCFNGQWADQVDCAAHIPFCVVGKCQATASNDCLTGSKRCYTSNEYQTCTNGAWDTQVNCATDDPTLPVCSGDGHCVALCTEDDITCQASDAKTEYRLCAGGKWSGPTKCPSSTQTCILDYLADGSGTSGCAECKVGEYRCKDGFAQSCTGTPPAWSTDTDCIAANGACVMTNGVSGCTECVPGDKQCGTVDDTNNQIQTCSASGKWGAFTNCGTNKCTEPAGGAHVVGEPALCNPSKPYCSAAGDVKCENNIYYDCTANVWTLNTQCTGLTPVCLQTGTTAASCVECTPNSRKCVDSLTEALCDATGAWVSTTCQTDLHCSAGRCQ